MQKPLTPHPVAKELRKFLRKAKVPYHQGRKVIVVNSYPKKQTHFPPLHFKFKPKTIKVTEMLDLGNKPIVVKSTDINHLLLTICKRGFINKYSLLRLI